MKNFAQYDITTKNSKGCLLFLQHGLKMLNLDHYQTKKTNNYGKAYSSSENTLCKRRKSR